MAYQFNEISTGICLEEEFDSNYLHEPYEPTRLGSPIAIIMTLVIYLFSIYPNFRLKLLTGIHGVIRGEGVRARFLSVLEEREKAKNDITKKSVFETSIEPNFINKTVAAICALYPALLVYCIFLSPPETCFLSDNDD